MPVDVTDFVKTDFTSTWPSNIAYEAAKLQDKGLADRYLRRLREAAATEGRDLSRREVLLDVARETGLELTRFESDLDGQAQNEFTHDRLECRQRDVHGFPTFLVRVDGKERLARGYRTYAQIAGLIDLLAGEPVERRQPESSDLSVLDVVEKYGSVAVREVSEIFEVIDVQARAVLDRLVESGAVELPPPGLLYRAPASGACDVETGGCD